MLLQNVEWNYAPLLSRKIVFSHSQANVRNCVVGLMKQCCSSVQCSHFYSSKWLNNGQVRNTPTLYCESHVSKCLSWRLTIMTNDVSISSSVPHSKYQDSTSNLALSRLHTSIAKKDNNKGNVHTNITLTCICLTTLGVQKQELLNIQVYVCSLSCPIYYVSPGWLNHIFPHYLINCTIFGKKLLNMCFNFLNKFFSNISHSKNSAWYYHAWAYIFMPSTHHSCQILQTFLTDF
jgi:hypothetical protein